MALPEINLNITNTIHRIPEDGVLVYKYSPFQNLKEEIVPNENDLKPLSLSASEADIDITKPINLDIETAYDGSVNLLVNDKTNPLKIINSRFYLTSNNTYKLADRKGNIDTNIYSVNNFKIETKLIKTARSIITLDFLGIEDGGILPVGNYNFYFKLADADGNESDFVAESGKVVCHIGGVNSPKSIRGGQLDENSDKLIRFSLNNLDLAYNYINIYYTKSSGDGDNIKEDTYKINDKIEIKTSNTIISITGYEDHVKIDNSEINIQYAEFDSAQTNANCQNITFVGNTQKNYDVFETLEKYSLLVTPEIVIEESIGNLDYRYEDSSTEGFEYYNAKNTYYKLGYWDEEIYRFGIVYILNDYTLSPSFNIRGIKTLGDDQDFRPLNVSDIINYDKDLYSLEDSLDLENPENVKGLFKIDTDQEIFNGREGTTPIGLRFNFTGNVLEGDLITGKKGLKELTKGFFIVRQKRIPTILTQAVGIATSEKSHIPLLYGSQTVDGSPSLSYFAESFLTKSSIGNPKLGRSNFKVIDVKNNALLCPEASLRKTTFNNIFNSSEFIIHRTKYETGGSFIDYSSGRTRDRELFYLGNLSKYVRDSDPINTSIILIEPGIELISSSGNLFSSRAGNPLEPWKVLDPIRGTLFDSSGVTIDAEDWSKDTTKVRGEFNTYLGTGSVDITPGQPYNIFQKNYNFNINWKNYFRVRYNNSSPFMAISDRIEWDNLEERLISSEYIYGTPPVYRGDCYINTYTHRMNWNFIDPELPTNTEIIDVWTWYKNYRVNVETIEQGTSGVVENTNEAFSNGDSKITYPRLLELFTYSGADLSTAKVTTEASSKFTKYSEDFGLYGASKINRPDVNAVPIGHYATFKICSNINLAMRDVDFNRPSEEAIFNVKRSFYPLQGASSVNKLPESSIINSGISKSLGDKYYYGIPDVPFIKTSFTTRIHYSNILQESTFKNGNRIFKSVNYQDYTNEYGSITKLVELSGRLIAIMSNGILNIPVNERALMTNASGENVYINTENVLPKNPKVLSNNFGSVWADSVIKTERYIYGMDTIGKKIWRTDGEMFEVISDLKIQKYLNEYLEFNQVESTPFSGIRFVKSHYNAFKKDILFVVKSEQNTWNLCWNELTNKWTTRYTWFPEFSENINNIFYTFANESLHPNTGNALYKHGFAGTSEEQGDILPTKWYEEQHPFEFEFVVVGIQGIQKIFNNLKIISNSTQPESFYYEIVGEGFDWSTLKDDIHTFVDDQEFTDYLTNNPEVKKIPYIKSNSSFVEDRGDTPVRDITLIEESKTKEVNTHIYQKGVSIKTDGRLKGNMNYVEDSWDIQIQPITFKYAYLLDGVLTLTNNSEMRIRDKYIKIRVRYDGTEYAIINSLKTLFTISYA